jgi:hypothetical protein
LKGDHYDDLYKRLNLLRRTATIWKLHAEAFFGYKILAQGHKVPGLRQRVERSIEGLYKQSRVSNRISWQGPPAGADEIRKVADELRSKLKQID